MKISQLLLVLVVLMLVTSQFSCCQAVSDAQDIYQSDLDQTSTAEVHLAETSFPANATAAYTEDCNAYEYMVVEAVITEETQYDTWRSCQYYLRVTNTLPNQDIWLWMHRLHVTEAGVDRDEWISAKVEAGATDEWAYGGDFQNDGTFGHMYVDQITAILAVPECRDMHDRVNAIPLARPVEWFCKP